MRALAHLWRDHRIAFLAFLAAATVSLFFAGRLIVFTVYWSDPAHRDQRPAGWMTPGYIARSWHVPRDDLGRELGLAPAPGKAQTLADIARARGQPLAEVIADIEAALTRLRQEPARK
ncbi:MAG: hypothetical protein R3E44_13810 [Paracoccaceae bacterium]